MVCTWAGRVWDGLYLCFYVNNCYRILYFAIVQYSQLQKMQKMKILFQLTTTVLTNLLLGVFCETKARFGQFKHLHAQIYRTKVGLELAEPRLGVVGKGKEPRWAIVGQEQESSVGGGQQGQRTEVGSGQPRVGRLGFVNSGTQMLELAERRVAGGWPRPGRLAG